jgi:hypothetical protein
MCWYNDLVRLVSKQMEKITYLEEVGRNTQWNIELYVFLLFTNTDCKALN